MTQYRRPAAKGWPPFDDTQAKRPRSVHGGWCDPIPSDMVAGYFSAADTDKVMTAEADAIAAGHRPVRIIVRFVDGITYSDTEVDGPTCNADCQACAGIVQKEQDRLEGVSLRVFVLELVGRLSGAQDLYHLRRMMDSMPMLRDEVALGDGIVPGEDAPNQHGM